MLAPGLIAQTLYACSAFYLEATRRPMPGLVVMIGANIANAFLNWIMIWGMWGFPELGSSGAALASTVVRIGAAIDDSLATVAAWLAAAQAAPGALAAAARQQSRASVAVAVAAVVLTSVALAARRWLPMLGRAPDTPAVEPEVSA